MSVKRILHILKKELIQIRRDPMMIRLIFFAPIMQLFIFGYAITSDIEHVTTAILDMDNTSRSRELVSRFAASPRYFVLSYIYSPRDVDTLLDSGRAQMAITIPRGFASDISSGRTADVQVSIDGSDSKTASIIGNYANTVCAQYSQQIITERLMRSGGTSVSLPSVDLRIRAWYNPDLKSVNYLVPGVLCLILLVVTMMLTSLAIVREREIGTLEQIIVTPIKPLELMLGKVTPFAAIGMINVLTIVLAASLWFKVPIEGSVLLLFALTIIFLTASLGLGLLVSTVSRTQQQAMMVSFFIMQPSVLLSGFMFPLDAMPVAIQYLTYLIPLRYYLEIVRGIFLRGVGIEVLWPQALCLLGLGGALLAASVVRFNKKIG
ncbi:MAG: ABC transporter permease [Armatimonadota bacterium]